MCSPMAAMFRRFFTRKVAMLVGVVLAGQLLAGILVQVMVIGPQTARVAEVTADTIEALSSAMADLPPVRRAALIAEINRGDNLLIRAVTDPPDDGRRFPSYVEYRFMRTLAARLTTQHRLDWITDSRDRLWVRLAIGREDYWVSMTPPRRRSAMKSLLMALAAAFVVAAVAGIFIQRWLDRPLRHLADAVDRYDPDRPTPPVEADGPREVAAVARAFNRLTQRIAVQEADRALMLGGVSHDLRTPLTRLRLSLEMLGDADPDMRASAVRQVDRIEDMLVQFLDFARGFEAEPVRRTDVSALVRRTAADGGADVRAEVADGIILDTRPQALARALANLVANALRHGAPPVRVEAKRTGYVVRITVGDAGQGIADAEVEALIRPFARGDAARGGGGTGLGLAIVDRAVRAIGGQLYFARRADGFDAVIEMTALQRDAR